MFIEIILCFQLKKRTIERRSSKDNMDNRLKNGLSNGVNHNEINKDGKGGKVSGA